MDKFRCLFPHAGHSAVVTVRLNDDRAILTVTVNSWRGFRHSSDARCPSTTTAAATPPADFSFQIADSSIDPRTFKLTRDGSTLDLTARELQLLRLFHDHPDEVLSRDRLLNEVWGHGYFGTTRTLDQVIVQLRRKLGDTGSPHRILLTVHGVGYRMTPACNPSPDYPQKGR